MSPSFPLGLALRWQRVTVAFVLTVAALWFGARAGGPPALWVSVAAVLAAVTLVTWRTAPLTRLAAAKLHSAGAARRLARASTSEYTLRWTTTPVAVRRVGDEAIVVIALDGAAHAPAVLDKHQVQSATTLSIHTAAELLRQFDVRLTGIDLGGFGHRRAPAGHHPHATTYSTRVGDYPAVGQRTSWCVLRFNVRENVEAVLCRDSVAAMITACAHRAAQTFTAAGCPARVVGTAELAQLDAALDVGTQVRPRPRWGGLSVAAGEVTTYWVSPKDITTATLDRLWVADTEHTAVTVQLRPGPLGTATIGVVVRYGTAGALREPPIAGLNPFSGHHQEALAAGLPEAVLPALAAPNRRLQPGEDLQMPVTATGIIIGATGAGHPLLINLGGPPATGTSVVTVAGELALLMQLALRSAAIGFRVLVVSDHPALWHPVSAPGLRVVDRRERLDVPDSGAHDAMIVVDTPDTGGDLTGSAAIVLRSVRPNSAGLADVHIEQDSPVTATVRTAESVFRARVDLTAERNTLAVHTTGRAAS